MTTAGARRKGAVLAVVLPATGLAAGCGRPGAREETSGARVSAGPPSPSATPPARLCAQLIGRWSRRTPSDDTCGDRQSMGLSASQYEILRKVMDAARARGRPGGRPADRPPERASRARSGAETESRPQGRGGPRGAG